jgi:hypothetical protein
MPIRKRFSNLVYAASKMSAAPCRSIAKKRLYLAILGLMLNFTPLCFGQRSSSPDNYVSVTASEHGARAPQHRPARAPVVARQPAQTAKRGGSASISIVAIAFVLLAGIVTLVWWPRRARLNSAPTSSQQQPPIAADVIGRDAIDQGNDAIANDEIDPGGSGWRPGGTAGWKPAVEAEVMPIRPGSQESEGGYGPDQLAGLVRNLQRNSESVERAHQQSSEQVLSFRVEISDAKGETVKYVPIELRNDLMFGDLVEGDRVRLAKADAESHKVEQIYNVTTNSYVCAGRPIGLVRAGSGSAEIVGVVRNVRRSVQMVHKPMGPQKGGVGTTTLQVVMFRVEVSDARGEIQRYIQVDMRGLRIRGDLADGDRVRFPDGGQGLYRINGVFNEKTASQVSSEKFEPKAGMAILLVLPFFAVWMVIAGFIFPPAALFGLLMIAIVIFTLVRSLRRTREMRAWN